MFSLFDVKKTPCFYLIICNNTRGPVLFLKLNRRVGKDIFPPCIATLISLLSIPNDYLKEINHRPMLPNAFWKDVNAALSVISPSMGFHLCVTVVFQSISDEELLHSEHVLVKL
jgi:hypothetical protein